MSRVNLGRVTMMPKGVWDSSSTYKRLDIVTNNGVSYIALQDVPANTVVTNTTYWMAVTPKISIGDVGTVSSYESASASMTNTSSGELKLNLSVPRGVSEQEDILHSASGSVVSFSDGIEAPAAQVKVKIEPIQEGEGDPSPDNVRPISGFDSVKVTRTGKNLFGFNKTFFDKTAEIRANPAQRLVITESTDDNSITFSYANGGWSYGYLVMDGIDGTKEYSIRYNLTQNTTSYTPVILIDLTRSNNSRLVLSVYGGNQSTVVSSSQSFTMSNIQVELGTEAHDYEPYSGQTVEVTFPSEAGTVYGGELDVTNGILTVNQVSIILDGSENWARERVAIEGQYKFKNSNLPFAGVTYDASEMPEKLLSNCYKKNSRNGLYHNPVNGVNVSDRMIQVYNENFNTSSANEWRSYLSTNHLQIVYELATPFIYHLTPIEITTLLGQNNIWANTGNTSVIYWQNKALADVIYSKFSITEDIIGAKKYGVKGIGQASSELTRTYDSINMVAEVGSPIQKARNDFDYAAPFKRRKCVGYWEKNPQHDKRAMFHVMAYEGDVNYTENGTMGDYVAVECPRCYYKRDGDELIISAHRYQGFRAFDIFCHEHNQNDTMEFYYMPAYPLALKDGHAVSLPGLRNEQGDWASLYNSVKTYNNEEIAVLAQLMPAAVNFYEWALMTVEFATQNMQDIMYGVAGCYNANNKVGQFTSLEEPITFKCNDNLTGIIEGDYVGIGTVTGGTDNNTLTSHKVLTATSSDGKRILTLEPTGWSTINYAIGTNYYISGRHVPTGLTKDILTPSGIEDHTATNTHNAIRYRYHENPYGNQYHTSADLFDVAILEEGQSTVNAKYAASLEWYYLSDATSVTTAVNPANNTTSLSTDEKFVKLGVSTPSEKYASGYIKSVQYDTVYPDIWIPETTEGGSATTYFSDQAYLVYTDFCCSCRFGGNWNTGTNAGPLYLSADHVPSYARATYGGDLYFPQ